MDFTLTDEQRQIYEYGDRLVQKFSHEQWLEHGRRQEFPKELFDLIAEDGFLGMMVPEEFGGAGLGMLEMALFMEGVSNNGIPLLMMVVGPCMSLSHIATHGTDYHKSELLPAACKGEIQFCFAITEPGAGSNSMKIGTVAKTNGDRYLLSGEKTYITGADVADYCLVVARTTPHDQVATKTEGFTLFAVDLKAKGIELQQVKTTIPMPEKQYTIYFDKVDLSTDDVVGEVGKGFEILFDSLNPERILVGAISAGIGRFALNKAVQYASERNVFDQLIGAHQGVQHPLARAYASVETASLMLRRAAWEFDTGISAAASANIAKHVASEAGIEAVEAVLQTHGGSGFTEDTGLYELYGLARLLRTAPVNRELCLSYIGNKVMGLPRSY